MPASWLNGSALTVVSALFVIIFLLRKKGVEFSLLILAALVAGGFVGVIFQGHTEWITPLGKVYISLLNALVIPLVMISIMSSVTSLGSIAQLRGIGARSVFWLLATTALSIVLALGLGLVSSIGTGSGISIAGVNAANYEGSLVPFSQVLVGLFPRNIIGDMNEEHIVRIILFTVLLAVSYVLAAHDDPERVAPFKRGIDAVKAVIFKAVGFIIELTPYAVLALTASVASNGLNRSGIMWSLLALLVLSFVAFALNTWVVNAVLLKVSAELSPWRFFRKILPAQLVGFSTQSSAGTLPLTTRILTERIGVAPAVANFTATLGTTIGMPGCSGIWPVLVAMYGIHGLGLAYAPADYIRLGLVSLIISLGTAGVPGTATIVTASVLTAAGLPLEILVLTLPISAIADTGRTATNITAAMVASAIVARKENALDDRVFLDGETHQPVSAGDPIDESPDADVVDHPRLRPLRPDVAKSRTTTDSNPSDLPELQVGEACPF